MERLSKPRGICIDPIHSQVFWADWGTTPFIARMDSDGTSKLAPLKKCFSSHCHNLKFLNA